MNQYPGYLTPDSLPIERHCRTFRIPDDVQWLSVFMGLLIPAIYPESWQQYGELTPDEAADAFLEIIWDAYENDMGQCQVVDAPFWDEISEAEDTYPPADQPWYGVLEGGSFRETLENWTIASFIAYSGNVGAAIQFLTIAPAFRLAWKSHDLGGLVRVIVDSVEMGRVDTYSDVPGEVYMDIAGLDPLIEEHELLIVLDAPPTLLAAEPTAAMQVVRKKLAATEIRPAGTRYNPDTDQVETFNGTTWVTDPAADPRNNPALRFPGPGGPDPACQAAANMSRYIEDFLADVTNTLGWATAAEGVLSTVLAGFAIAFPPSVSVGLFAFLALDVATVLFSAGITAIEAQFTATVFDQLTCIFYCYIDDEGQLRPGSKEAIEADIADQIGGLVSLVTSGMFLLMGETGLNNAGSIGEAPADCSGCDCGWCFEFTDFSSWTLIIGTDDTWYNYWGLTLPNDGTYTLRSAYAEWDWNQLGGGGDSGLSMMNNFSLAGPTIIQNVSPLPNPTNLYTENMSTVTTQFVIGANAFNTSGNLSPCRVTFRGTGTCPFGEPNCE